jgi:riboflavin-specific deaminase-like protein
MRKAWRTKRGATRAAERTRPYVVVNMAVTADGKIATANRAISSFGSKRDREHLLELRATADAVMAGARTVDTNPIDMGPGGKKFRRKRVQDGRQEYNLRVIVSRSGSVDPEALVFKKRFSPVVVLTTKRAGIAQLASLRLVGAEIHVGGEKDINFAIVLSWLADKWRVRRLICEGGGELNSALFRAGLIDEIHLTICPYIFAGGKAPTIADGIGFAKLANAGQFGLKSMRRVGLEVFLRFVRTGARTARAAGSWSKEECQASGTTTRRGG